MAVLYMGCLLVKAVDVSWFFIIIEIEFLNFLCCFCIAPKCRIKWGTVPMPKCPSNWRIWGIHKHKKTQKFVLPVQVKSGWVQSCYWLNRSTRHRLRRELLEHGALDITKTLMNFLDALLWYYVILVSNFLWMIVVFFCYFKRSNVGNHHIKAAGFQYHYHYLKRFKCGEKRDF